VHARRDRELGQQQGRARIDDDRIAEPGDAGERQPEQ
jgi:hypothetical protein